jgi:hypothetical protein
MTLADRDQKIEAFPAYTANQPFAVRISLGRTEGSLQNSYSHLFHTEIQLLRVNAVSIVNQKPIALVVAQGLPKLLQSLGCVGMGSNIEVDKCAYLHNDKHIEDLEARRYGDKEIAGQHGLCVISDEGHPSLGWIRAPSTAVWILQQIFLRGSRGNLNPELYEELSCYASLSPCGIFPRHGQNEATKIPGNRRPAYSPGFPTPE